MALDVIILSYLSMNSTWGPFLESPGNLTGPESYF